jgi:type II secretory pathway predicted ATPase ExeA
MPMKSQNSDTDAGRQDLKGKTGMYESFFQLEARPFLPSPVADRYFGFAAAEHARETVLRCIQRAEGPAVILGGAGTGKSTLCQVIAKQLHDQFRVATLASARLCTRRALLQNILFELQLPYRDRDEGELRLSLIDALEPSETCPHGMLLIVDEAHMLPLRLLEEIRLITNLVRQGQPRVRLLLAGGLLLDERLAAPRMESLNQRVVARCYLQAMSREETVQYVRAQLQAVGGDPDRVFAAAALPAIYHATNGIPRLVNQVCDHVLLLAAIGRRATVDVAGVEEAWADLQQLPTPWNHEEAPRDGAPQSQRDILEFGQLDDEACGELDRGKELPATPASSTRQPAGTVLSRLEAIGSDIDELARDDEFLERPSAAEVAGPTQFRPQICREPEIELMFHRAHDPFREKFQQEEVVVDPAASLGMLSPATMIPAEDAADETSCDPVWPEQSAAVNTPVMPATRFVVEGESLPGDDRDLLEMIAESSHVPDDYSSARESNRPRRREYRQLFATLRRR